MVKALKFQNKTPPLLLDPMLIFYILKERVQKLYKKKTCTLYSELPKVETIIIYESGITSASYLHVNIMLPWQKCITQQEQNYW